MTTPAFSNAGHSTAVHKGICARCGWFGAINADGKPRKHRQVRIRGTVGADGKVVGQPYLSTVSCPGYSEPAEVAV